VANTLALPYIKMPEVVNKVALAAAILVVFSVRTQISLFIKMNSTKK